LDFENEPEISLEQSKNEFSSYEMSKNILQADS